MLCFYMSSTNEYGIDSKRPQNDIGNCLVPKVVSISQGSGLRMQDLELRVEIPSKFKNIWPQVVKVSFNILALRPGFSWEIGRLSTNRLQTLKP